MTRLNLLVLYCRDLQRSKAFYEQVLGISFVTEKHGEGPVHFAATMANEFVLELYPDSSQDDGQVRNRPLILGFAVPSLSAAVGAAGFTFKGLGRQTITDPDGYWLMLTESKR